MVPTLGKKSPKVTFCKKILVSRIHYFPVPFILSRLSLLHYVCSLSTTQPAAIHNGHPQQSGSVQQRFVRITRLRAHTLSFRAYVSTDISVLAAYITKKFKIRARRRSGHHECERSDKLIRLAVYILLPTGCVPFLFASGYFGIH